MGQALKRTSFGTAIVALSAILLVACAEDTRSESSTTSNQSETTTTDVAAALDLTSVCPPVVVVQTDWFPQAEHGGTYELLGDDYVVDAATGTTRGSLTVRGVDTGVDLEIRAGGPFLESPVVTEMFLDDSITMGYVGNDVALARFAETPTLAVFNALTINPQVILWNKANHPDASSISDIAKQVSAISVFGDRPFMRYFVSQGVVSAEKVDGNYKGSLMLVTDDVAHQGFVTSEPFRYQRLESGPIDVGYQLIHDAGWTSYPQNLAINLLRLEDLRPCLNRLVPLMQQAQIDFITSPNRTITTIIDVVIQLDTYWTQSTELAEYAVATMSSLGIVGNGSTPTFGDFESPRIDRFIELATPILRDQGLEVPNLVAGDIATNEFLDSSISMP